MRVWIMLIILACMAGALNAGEDVKSSDKVQALFTVDGPPKGWLVRRWDDVSQEADGAWMVKDGVLHGDEPRGSWLMSEREYGDLELQFEFRLGKLGNSGLALRSPLKGDPAFDGIEVQMVDLRYNPEAKDSELTGGLYRAVAPRKQAYKPEKWNKYEVVLRGPRMRIKLNSELIHDLDLTTQAQPVKRHDGSDAPSIKLRPRRGHIGFQNLSRGEQDVQIRNVRLKALD
jgi:hypothetical protein